VVLRNSLGAYQISYTRLSLSLVNHSRLFYYLLSYHIGLLQPPVMPRMKNIVNRAYNIEIIIYALCALFYVLRAKHDRVWTVAISFATTEAIFINFFSSGYLDVSVPQVPFYTLIFIPKNKTWCVNIPFIQCTKL
jgi:hypothetical protein